MAALVFMLCFVAGAAQAQTAFVNANVIPMTDDEVREGWTVVVDGTQIAAAGPADEVDIPAGATVIEADGQYLIPGLAEMHGHIPPTEERAYAENVLFLYVANGVTTVRGMQGSQGQLELRGATRDGTLMGPNLYLAGPAFSGGSVDSPEQAAQRVRDQAAEGWDYLKVLGGLSMEEYDAMAEAAHEEGIPFVGHVPSDVGIVHAIEAGQETVDHLDGYMSYLESEDGTMDPDRLSELVDLTVEHGTWLVPTMAVWETLLAKTRSEDVEGYSELQYMPPGVVEDWMESLRQRRADDEHDQAAAELAAAERIRLLGAMNDAGARILMGTDAPQWFSVPGFSLQRELPIMRDAGMTPYEILVSGTRSVGEYIDAEEDFGTITAGSRADVILLNSNPLDDVMNVFDQAGVMVRGRWLPQAEIEDRLAEIAASN
jgi:imidazolonepropionase-like amidohydrolase